MLAQNNWGKAAFGTGEVAADQRGSAPPGPSWPGRGAVGRRANSQSSGARGALEIIWCRPALLLLLDRSGRPRTGEAEAHC